MGAPGSISLREARLLALVSQGLAGPRWRGGPAAMLRRLGAVQLDTISVLARSHLLVAWARLGALGREQVESCYWDAAPSAFEYWAHAACILPLEHFPLFAFRRRERRARGRRWHRLEEPDRICATVLAHLRAEGPLTASELGGAKAGGPWWDWTEQKIAVEWLLDIGEVVCTTRVGWRRVYDLTERAIPSALVEIDPTDEECLSGLVALAGRALGVATLSELASYYGLTLAQARVGLAGTDLVPVTVGAPATPHFGDPEALALLGKRLSSRTTLLSPFDSLLWDRRRAARLFGIVHRLEAYVPRPQRVHGYYAMPVLGGGRIIGRVDPARDKTRFIARRVSVEDPRDVPLVARALRDAAAWVDRREIAIEHVDNAATKTALEHELLETVR